MMLAQRPWLKEDSLLSRPASVRGGGRMAVGGTYVLGLQHDMLGRKDYKLEDLARSLGAAGNRKALHCLKELPRDFTDSGMQVFTEPAPKFGFTGLPDEARQYVRVPSNATINDEAVTGAILERFYIKTNKPDPAGRGFLTRDGIYQAGEAKPEYGSSYYLMDAGKNGETRLYYDYVVLYDDLKKMLRDPGRKPATRF